MDIKQAVFIKSSASYKDCPQEKRPEYAFIGRSNVGKSSFINMLTGNNKLAKISSKPGKTQLINHFLINNEWFLVDLPGYGYAKTSKNIRNGFAPMISEYVLQRKNLIYLCVLIDSRLQPQQIDLDFIAQLGENGIPFVLIFTKSDKQSASRTQSNVQTFLDTLSREWEELPPYFISSAVTHKGKEDFLDFIQNTNLSIQDYF
ncbi:MAG: YihA family ribosome biogenesis GTP-binding protein [Bacteroidales bacterium]|nr:YihA family ribosome biogenesis GTP-binding protein [Bacteroidales bacterium]